MLPHSTEPLAFRRRKEEQGLFDKDTYLFPHGIPRGLLLCKAKKIVFLNKEALCELEGYKAAVRLTDSGEIHIILTGFSSLGAKQLYDRLKAMKPEEVYGDNG